MLQENSFFSRPLIFYGSPQNIDEEIDQDEEEWIFGDPWSISPQTDFSHHQQTKIGLFIHWPELNA